MLSLFPGGITYTYFYIMVQIQKNNDGLLMDYIIVVSKQEIEISRKIPVIGN